GPHATGGGKNKRIWEIRAFLPQARSVSVIDGDTALPMNKLHQDGFFVAETDTKPAAYRLRLETHEGQTLEQEDPYRFPKVMTEFDLHLHGEGTLHEAWHSYGAHLTTLEGIAGVRFAVWAPNAEGVS